MAERLPARVSAKTHVCRHRHRKISFKSKHQQGRQLHHRLCVPGHRHADRRPRFINGLCVVGICSAQVPRLHTYPSWPQRAKPGPVWSERSNGQITWGIMIMFLHILRLLENFQRYGRLAYPMGCSNDPCHHPPLRRHVLPSCPNHPGSSRGKIAGETVTPCSRSCTEKVTRTAPFVVQEFQDGKRMCEFKRNNANASFLELFKPNMINRTHIGVFT